MAVTLSGRVSANIALIGSPRSCSLSLTVSASFRRKRCSQRFGRSGSPRQTGLRETASLQCAGLPGGGTALSGSAFTVIRNIAKHIATMTNVTTVKMSFLKTPIVFCFAVTSVSQLPSRDLPTLALFDAYGRPSRIKHRELRRIAAKEKAIRVCRMNQDQWTAGISQPLGYDFLRRAEGGPRMEPG